MLRREIKHSEVEEQYTKEKLNDFYNKAKQELIKELFDNPYDEISLSNYFYIDDKGYPVPPELNNVMETIQEKEFQESIVRVFDYSVIEDLI
jgi:hypothetical protein